MTLSAASGRFLSAAVFPLAEPGERLAAGCRYEISVRVPGVASNASLWLAVTMRKPEAAAYGRGIALWEEGPLLWLERRE